MPKKKDRSSKYLIERLKRDFPAVHKDLVAGRYPSVRQAAAKAGLIRLPTRLHALKREWKRATNAEQIAFLKWLKAGSPTARKVSAPRSIIDADGHLRPLVARFLSDWIRARKSKPGRIMKEMGFSVFDWTLSSAIDRAKPLRPDVIPKLEGWLTKNGFSW